MNQRWIVTTAGTGDSSHRRAWDTRRRLELGHRDRWTIERRGTEFVAREKRAGGQVITMSQEDARRGADFRLAGLRVSLRPGVAVLPASRTAALGGPQLRVAECVGPWIREIVPLLLPDTGEARYVGRRADEAVFTLQSVASIYILHAEDELTVRTGEVTYAVPAGTTLNLSRAELSVSEISAGSLRWIFQAVSVPAVSRGADAAPPEFGRALQASSAVAAGIVAIIFFWPGERETRVEPLAPQPARLATARPTQAARKAGRPSPRASSALRKSLRGLLNGGMTQLLAKSEFASGADSSENAKRLFQSRESSIGGKGVAISGQAVNVAQIGGSGGTSPGYGKGERVGVQGQGNSFVSMDSAGALVDDGLTRDQVGEVIHRHLAEIRYCYEAAILRSPQLEGRMVAAFTIGGAGAVSAAGVRESSVGDPSLNNCILRRLASWKFPLPRGGVQVAVTYPFIFKTLGRSGI